MKYLKFLMIPVILLALVLPQVLFSAQDHYRTGKTYAGKRESVDPTILNLKYVDGKAYDKMSWLAKGFDNGHEMHLLQVEGELSREKQEEYVKNVFSRDTLGGWIYWAAHDAYSAYAVLQEESNFDVFPVYYVKEKNGVIQLAYSAVLFDQTERWKKYILVDEQELEALELWYGNVQISEKPEINMQILADAEDELIYYLQFQKAAFPEGFSESDLEELNQKYGMVLPTQQAILGELAALENEEKHNVLVNEPIGTYYPKDYVFWGEQDESGLITTLNYQRWIGDIDRLHCEYFLDAGTSEPYFLRFGIRELRELLPNTAP